MLDDLNTYLKLVPTGPEAEQYGTCRQVQRSLLARPRRLRPRPSTRAATRNQSRRLSLKHLSNPI